MRIHIGHHFFGAGNIGDDWMLAGFLHAFHAAGGKASFTLCTPFDLASQQRRFPQIEWLPLDEPTRRKAIAEADAWLGLGDTPFQSDSGSWFLEHLMIELALCGERDLPMWFLGVGVNNRDVFADERARTLATTARRIWTRDRTSAAWIGGAAGEHRVTAGADLAHAFLATASGVGEPSTGLAMCLNFESRPAFDVGVIERLILESPHPVAWVVQEVRALSWSERTILDMLSARARERATVVAPDYACDSVTDLYHRWPSPGIALSSRYHAALAFAWRGVPVVPVLRSDKLAALAEDLALPPVPSLTAIEPVLEAFAAARPVSRELLDTRARRTAGMVRDWMREAGVPMAG